MSEPEDAPVKRRWFRPGRGLALLLGLVAFLEAVYVGGGLILVRSGQVDRWINTQPDKLKITFDSVLPIVPGLVRVRGFRLLIQDRANQIDARVDHVWAGVNLLELPGKRLHFVLVRATGVTYRMRTRPVTAPQAKELPAGYPAIDGVPYTPFEGPKGEKPKDRLALVFTRSMVRDIREVWLNERRFQGKGAVDASVTVDRDGTLEIPWADVRFEETRVQNGPDETYRDVRLRVVGNVPRFDPDGPQADALLTLLKLRIEASGRMPSGAAYLNVFFRNAPWIRFEGGDSLLTLRLTLKEGQIAAGGFLELARHDLAAEFSGFRAKGTAGVRLDVLPVGERDHARLVVAFDQYALHRGKASGKPLVAGKGLRISVTTPASLRELPPKQFSGKLELGKAELPSLDFVNALLPATSGVKIRSGSAKVEGTFDVLDGGGSVKGSLRIAANGLAMDAGGVGMKGGFALALRVPKGDLLRQRFDADGTKLTLDGFSFESKAAAAGVPDWSASVAYPRFHLEMGDALSLLGRMELEASDSRPLVAFLSKDEPLSGWKKRLLTFGTIKGSGEFELGDQLVAVEKFSIGWEGTEIRARVRLDPKGTNGKVFVKYGILRAGIGLEGEKRSVKVVKPETWFEAP